MRYSIILVLVAACAPPAPPPLSPMDARASVVELADAVKAAAMQCTANARSLDDARGEALFDACVRALIPAHDSLLLVRESSDQAAVGCVAKSVRVGLEGVRDAFAVDGFELPPLARAGLVVGRRLEVYASPSCDPLHPTTSVQTFVDPNIAPVEPDYPR